MRDKNRVHNRILRTLMTIMMVAALIVSAIPAWAVYEAPAKGAAALSTEKSAGAAAGAGEEEATKEGASAGTEEVSETEESNSGADESGADSLDGQDTEGQDSEGEGDYAADDADSEDMDVTDEEVSDTTEEEVVTVEAPKARLRSRSTRSASTTKTITVTKTWLNDDDSVRPNNLMIHVKQKNSLLIPGGSNDNNTVSPLEDKMKRLAGNGQQNENNTNILAIKYATDAQYEAIKLSLTSDNEIQADGEKTYMWFDSSDGTIYFYSEAEVIYLNSNSGGLFRRMINLTDISGLSHLDTSYVTDMNRMFQNAKSLVDLSPISGWNTHYVRYMNWIFGQAVTGASESMATTDASLSSLSNWDVSNVSTFDQAFKNSRNITSLSALSNWNVSRLTNVNQMFNWCTGLTDDGRDYIKGWDMRAVDTWTGMFNNTNSTVTKPIFDSRPGTWSSTYNAREMVYKPGTYLPEDAAVTPADPDTPPAIETTFDYSDNGSGHGSGSNPGDCVVTKSGNVWTYEFTVPDNGGKWTVWEETDSQGKYLDDKNGLADAYTESSDGTEGLGGSETDAIKGVTDSASITNTNTKRKEIIVTKNWDDDSNAAGARPADVKLHLMLSGTDVKTSDASGWTKSGDTWSYTFIDYSNSSVTDYSVSEDNVQFYDSDGYTAKTVIDSGGSLPDTGEVTITNEYKAYDLTISKEVTGNQGDKTKKFDVTIGVRGVVPERTYTVTNTGGTPDSPATVTSDSSGNISATINLKDTDSIKIEGIPKGAAYDVSEDYGDYDPTVTVTGDSSATTGSGSASGTLSANTGVKFTNDKSGILPTGLFNGSNYSIVMLLAALAGIALILIFAIRKRRVARYE